MRTIELELEQVTEPVKLLISYYHSFQWNVFFIQNTWLRLFGRISSDLRSLEAQVKDTARHAMRSPKSVHSIQFFFLIWLQIDSRSFTGEDSPRRSSTIRPIPCWYRPCQDSASDAHPIEIITTTDENNTVNWQRNWTAHDIMCQHVDFRHLVTSSRGCRYDADACCHVTEIADGCQQAARAGRRPDAYLHASWAGDERTWVWRSNGRSQSILSSSGLRGHISIHV
jgi:hypothetical protein